MKRPVDRILESQILSREVIGRNSSIGVVGRLSSVVVEGQNGGFVRFANKRKVLSVRWNSNLLFVDARLDKDHSARRVIPENRIDRSLHLQKITAAISRNDQICNVCPGGQRTFRKARQRQHHHAHNKAISIERYHETYSLNGFKDDSAISGKAVRSFVGDFANDMKGLASRAGWNRNFSDEGIAV